MFSFFTVIIILLVIGQYKKHKTTIEWAFEVLAVIPIFWIFTCIFFIISRKEKLNDIKFVGFTQKFINLRKVFFIFLSSMAVFFAGMLVYQYATDEAWERQEQIKFFLALGGIVLAGIVFLLLLYQNQKVKQTKSLTARSRIRV